MHERARRTVRALLLELVRVVAITGELLRDLTTNPDMDYQPQGPE